MLFCWTFSRVLRISSFFIVAFSLQLIAAIETVKSHVDPAGFFRVSIPIEYFSCELIPRKLSCKGLLDTSAQLSLIVKDVPRDAHIDNVALNQLEEYEKKTRFQQLTKVETTIDSKPALRQSFSFDALANIARPTWVQFIDVLDSGKLAVLKVTCASQKCLEYSSAISKIEQSLKMAPIGRDGRPDQKKLAISDSYTPVTILELDEMK